MNVKELLIGVRKYFIGVLVLVTFVLSFAIGVVLFAKLSLSVSGWFLIPLIIYASFMISIVIYCDDVDIRLW